MITIRRASIASGLCRCLRILLFIVSVTRICFAVEIGQTRQEIVARHGTPPLGDTPRGIAVYWWDVWKLEIEFVDDSARKLTYTKTDRITDSDIVSILFENGGNESWRQINPRLWFRADGAMATLDGSNSRTLVLRGVHRFVRPTAVASSSPESSPLPERSPTTASTSYSTPSPSALAATMATHPNASVAARASVTPAVTSPPAAHSSGIRWVPFLVLLIAIGAGVRFYSLLGPLNSSVIPRSSDQSASDYSKHRGAKSQDLLSPASVVAPSINSITWDQFELVIAEIFRRNRYTVEVSSGLGSDGGVDVKAMRDGLTTLVQCKYWRAWKVSVKSIREFYGVLVSEGAHRGIFVTTGKYTKDCREFAAGKPIELLSRPDIEQMVKSVERPGENIWSVPSWIETFVAAAWIREPDCPYCRKSMLLRYPKNGVPFWGCSTFPACRGKREVRLDILKVKPLGGVRNE